MFLGLLTRFFLSFLVSNWIYSEAVLFFPPLAPVAEKVFQTTQIPTHNKWHSIASAEGADRLASDVERAMAQNTPWLGVSFSTFFDRQVRSIWKAGSFRSMFSSNSIAVSKPYLSGDEIFDHRAVELFSHNAF